MESSNRWGRGRYLFTWLCLVGAQGLTFQSVVALQREGAGSEEMAVYGVGIALLQAMKLVPTLGRLKDLGRPPDDALWTFVPLMNVALWTWLLAATPSPARWEARRRVWADTLQALPAYGLGIRRALGLAGPAAIAAGLLVAGHLVETWWLSRLLDAAPEARAQMAEVAMGGAVLAIGYGVWRWSRGARASVGSWWPAWLAIPALLAWASLAVDVSGDAGGTAGLMVLAGLGLSVTMVVSPVAWALAMSRWLPALERAAGRPPVDGRVAPLLHAGIGRMVVVQIGLQLALLPGVWFAIRWALADVAAVRAPDRSPFGVASEVAADRQGTLLKLLLIYVLVGTLSGLLTLPLVGGEIWQGAMVGANTLPWPAALVEGAVVAVVGLALAAALREVADDAALASAPAEAARS